MKAWIFQIKSQITKHGAAAASWYVGWRDPENRQRCKSYGAGVRGKTLAEKEARRIDAELLTGTYEARHKEFWAQFRKEYEVNKVDGMTPRTRMETLHALTVFEQLVKPNRMATITSRTIADFTTKRRKKVAAPTVNKELRHLRAAIRKAHKWGFLSRLPDFDFFREDGKLPRYVTPEHFAKLYAACDRAIEPAGYSFTPDQWWRGLLVFIYMTGWRISATLAVRLEDLDAAAATLKSQAADNKGRRDQLIALHPLILSQLQPLILPPSQGLRAHRPDSRPRGQKLFPWPRRRASLWDYFRAVQTAAELPVPAYGFHDLRRAFATMNFDRLPPEVLQQQMQHKDYKTTQLYINLARQLRPAVQNTYVPDLDGTAIERKCVES